MAVYPNALPNLPANHVDNIGEIIEAEDVNDPTAELNAALGILGLNPQGSYSSVRARLDDTGGGVPSTGVNRDALTIASDGTTQWSTKVTPYNPYEAAAGVGQGNATTDRSALQTTLTAATGKGPVFVPPGPSAGAPSILLDGTALLVPSNTHLFGKGRGKSIIKVDNSVTFGLESIHNSNFAGSSNIVIEDLEIDGNRVGRGLNDPFAAGVGAGLMQFRGIPAPNTCTNIHIRRVYQHHAPGIGISFQSGTHCSITDSTIYANGRDGVGTYGPSTFINISRNTIYDCGDDLIAIHGHQAGWDQATPSQFTDNVVLANNILLGGTQPGNGINVTGSRRVAITGNVMRDNNINGIHIRNHETAYCEDIQIVGNSIAYSGVPQGSTGDVAYGIHLSIDSDNYYAGIPTPSPGGTAGNHAIIRHIVIAGNTIAYPVSHAIKLAGPQDTGSVHQVSNTVIDGNILVGNSASTGYANAAGVFFQNARAQYTKICNNMIHNFAGRGISNNGAAISFGDITNNTLINNCFVQTGTAGIYMPGSLDFKVQGNRVHDLKGTKTEAYALNWDNALRMHVEHNDFRGAGLTGTVTGTKSSTTFEHYNVQNNGSVKIGDVAGTGGVTAGNMV